MKVAKRVDLKNPDPKGKKYSYVWYQITRFIVAIISQYIQILNHYIVTETNAMLYLNYISIIKKECEMRLSPASLWLLKPRTGSCLSVQFICSVVSDSATPWTAAHRASLSIINPPSLFKLISIKLVMPSNHLILCCPILILPSIFPNIRSFLTSQFFVSGGQSIEASASVLPMNIQD